MVHFKRFLAGAMVVTVAAAIFAVLCVAMKFVSGWVMLSVCGGGFFLMLFYAIGNEIFPDA